MNKTTFVVSLLFVGLVFTQTPLEARAQNPLPQLPGAGLTPDSPFYFLDRWSEGIQELLTFSNEGRARLQVSLIAERTSEIKAMLGREVPNHGAIQTAFARIELHTNKASIALEQLRTRADIAPLAATLADEMSILKDFLDDAVEGSIDRLKALADAELAQKMNDINFIQTMESELKRIADKIDEELGRPLVGFTVVSYNIDVDDDTYSSTHEAEAGAIVDLAALKARILPGTAGWESGNVVLGDDSLDITFEKAYPPVTIDGIELIPDASVTISVTTNSPRQGMTSISYDIDITLETKSEYLAGLLEDELDKMEEKLDNLSDQLEGQMDAESAALKAIQEAKAGKQEAINEAVAQGMAITAVIFGAFDALLAQAESALGTGNFQEAKRLADQAKKTLDSIMEEIGKAAERLERELPLQENGMYAPRPPAVPGAEEEFGQPQGLQQQAPVRPGGPRTPVQPLQEPGEIEQY